VTPVTHSHAPGAAMGEPRALPVLEPMVVPALAQVPAGAA